MEPFERNERRTKSTSMLRKRQPALSEPGIFLGVRNDRHDLGALLVENRGPEAPVSGVAAAFRPSGKTMTSPDGVCTSETERCSPNRGPDRRAGAHAILDASSETRTSRQPLHLLIQHQLYILNLNVVAWMHAEPLVSSWVQLICRKESDIACSGIPLIELVDPILGKAW